MYLYAGAKLRGAVSDLVGRDSQRERLQKAYIYNLSGLTAETDVPSWFRAEFEKFQADLTRVAAKGDEGTIRATLAVIGDEEVDELCERVVSMYDRVAREQGPLD